MLNVFVACTATDKSIWYEFDSHDNSCAILYCIVAVNYNCLNFTGCNSKPRLLPYSNYT